MDSDITTTVLGILLCVGILTAFSVHRRHMRSTWQRGMQAYQHNDLKEVLKAFSYIVKKQPGSADARRMYARALTATGALEQAEKELNFALQLEPRNPDVRIDMAVFLTHTSPRRDEEAVAMLEEAVDLKPELRMSIATLKQFEDLRRNARFCVLAGLPEPVITSARLN